MTNSTAHLTRWAMPTKADQALIHLNTHHGWDQRIADPGMVQAHRYAHGVDGRPDLADAHVNHTHAPGAPAAKSWPPPATPQPYGYTPTAEPARTLKYMILGWNILMAAWIVYALVAITRQYDGCAADTYRSACQAGTSAGAMIAVGGILFLTAVVDVILAVIWMVTKKD